MAASTMVSASRTLVLAVTLPPKTTTQGPLTQEPNKARGQRLDTLRAEPGMFLHVVGEKSESFAKSVKIDFVIDRLFPPGLCRQCIQPPLWSTTLLRLLVTSLSPSSSRTHLVLPSASSPSTATQRMRMTGSSPLRGELFPPAVGKQRGFISLTSLLTLLSFPPAAPERAREPM